jgi:hypothetical protein
VSARAVHCFPVHCALSSPLSDVCPSRAVSISTSCFVRIHVWCSVCTSRRVVCSGTLAGPWIMDSLGELIVAVEGCQGNLAPVLAVLKRCAVRWFTTQKTSEDGDRLRYLSHTQHMRDRREERKVRARAVREERDKKAQGGFKIDT